MTAYKAIIYAAAASKSLYPATSVVPIGLLPIYDKPLIYYTLSVAVLAGIRDVVLISTAEDQQAYRRLLGCGSQFGMGIEYLTHELESGLGQSFLSARAFLNGSHALFLFADSLIYGDGLQRILSRSLSANSGVTGFARPRARNENDRPVQIDDAMGASFLRESGDQETRPTLASLYAYSSDVFDVAAQLQTASGTAVGITDINHAYFTMGRSQVVQLGRGFAILDIDTHASLSAAANFISTIQSTHELQIGCVEEAALQMGFLDGRDLHHAASQFKNNYGKYLSELASKSNASEAEI